jgi:hypothetical protein
LCQWRGWTSWVWEISHGIWGLEEDYRGYILEESMEYASKLIKRKKEKKWKITTCNRLDLKTHEGFETDYARKPHRTFWDSEGCGSSIELLEELLLRATPHTRLRARDRYTSSTLIGGKGGASPSLVPTTLEGPTAYVNARWM